jgi:hypothetical protein
MAKAEKASRRERRKIAIPQSHDWRTTDADEINKRRWRAQTESPGVVRLDRRHPVFSNFRVGSNSGMSYNVEIRSLSNRLFSCACVDFRINGLGTCKHVEATLLYLEARYPRLFRRALKSESTLIDIVPDEAAQGLRIERLTNGLPGPLRALATPDGRLRCDDFDQALEGLRRLPLKNLRVSQEIDPWLRARKEMEERKVLLREYEQKVQAGEWPPQETLEPLYPYQREGMLHLAFKERALLADEMGLGKTIQAIAACALLQRLGKVSRVLVVTPASLKTEWEEQIQRFTRLPYQLIFGPRWKRLPLYASAPFFTVVNYEQMVRDSLDVNVRLKPDVVILDEAQRIKNWNTKTAQAVKRLRSRYAFVLTGTPIENRIDELYSLMDFLNPAVLGPLFRFNREFYELDERGRPCGYRNIEQLHAKIQPFMLRRRKADVETELPERSERTFFVSLSREQKTRYDEYYDTVARLASIAKRRPLTEEEAERLLRALSMMRMVCDTNYILDPKDKTCPKLSELEKILEECRENSDVKVLIFSEWARMIELVRGLCEKLGIGYAIHTGSIPQAAAQARGDLALQERPRLPYFSQHRFRQHRTESAERERGDQLRFTLESGQAGAANRARLAQTPDPVGYGHQSGFGKHHRTPDAEHLGEQAGAGGGGSRLARRYKGSPLQGRTAGPACAPPASLGTCGSFSRAGSARNEACARRPGSGFQLPCRGKIGSGSGALRGALPARRFSLGRRGGRRRGRSSLA